MEPRVLVTGASGLLGSNCLLEFSRGGWAPRGWSNRNGGSVGPHPLFQIDLQNLSQVEDELKRFAPNLIVHAAAWTQVDGCEANETLAQSINGDLPGALAQMSRSLNCSFVYVSTDAVYDGETGNYSESSPTRPVNAYARSKLAGEKAVLAADPNALILRAAIHGWNFLDKFSFSESILSGLINKEPLGLFSDAVFSPILVNHLARVILELFKKGASGTFNIGSPDSISKLAFGYQIAEVFNLDKSPIQPIQIADAPLKAPRPRNVSLNVSKLTAILGHPLPSSGEGIVELKGLLDAGFVSLLKNRAFQWPSSLTKGIRHS